jgi:hypothetical protein
MTERKTLNFIPAEFTFTLAALTLVQPTRPIARGVIAIHTITEKLAARTRLCLAPRIVKIFVATFSTRLPILTTCLPVLRRFSEETALSVRIGMVKPHTALGAFPEPLTMPVRIKRPLIHNRSVTVADSKPVFKPAPRAEPHPVTADNLIINIINVTV